MPLYSDFSVSTNTDSGLLYTEETLLRNKLLYTNITAKPLLWMLTKGKKAGILTPDKATRFKESNDGSQLQRNWYMLMGDAKATKAARISGVGRTRALHLATVLDVTAETRVKAESYSQNFMMKIELSLMEMMSSMELVGKGRVSDSVYMEKFMTRMEDYQDKLHLMLVGRQACSAPNAAAASVTITGMLNALQNSATVHNISQSTYAGWAANIQAMGGASFNDDAFISILADHQQAGRKTPDLAVCSKSGIFSRVRSVYNAKTVTVLNADQSNDFKAGFINIVVSAGDGEIVFATDNAISSLAANVTIGATVTNSINCFNTKDYNAWLMKPRAVSSGTVGGELGLDKGTTDSGAVVASDALYSKTWFAANELLCENPFNQLALQDLAPS